MASMTCSHARSVASEQFKNSETPNRAKTFKPKYTNGLKDNRRKKHCCKIGTCDVLKVIHSTKKPRLLKGVGSVKRFKIAYL